MIRKLGVHGYRATSAPAPKSQSVVLSRVQTSTNQVQPGLWSADASSSLKEGGGCSQSHSTLKWRVWTLRDRKGGSVPRHSSFCSIPRPELRGPVSCWPGSPLLLHRIGGRQLPDLRPGGGHSLPFSSSSSSSVSNDSAPDGFVGWVVMGVVLGGRGVQIFILFFVFGSNLTGSAAGKGLSAPEERCRAPTGCCPGFLRSSWLPPPSRGSSRRPCEGS